LNDCQITVAQRNPWMMNLGLQTHDLRLEMSVPMVCGLQLLVNLELEGPLRQLEVNFVLMYCNQWKVNLGLLDD